jgi:hypothetical protein
VSLERALVIDQASYPTMHLDTGAGSYLRTVTNRRQGAGLSCTLFPQESDVFQSRPWESHCGPRFKALVHGRVIGDLCEVRLDLPSVTLPPQETSCYLIRTNTTSGSDPRPWTSAASVRQPCISQPRRQFTPFCIDPGLRCAIDAGFDVWILLRLPWDFKNAGIEI